MPRLRTNLNGVRILLHTVKQHPYRTATVGSHFMQVNRTEARDLENQLVEAACSRPDNHVVYEVTTPSGAIIYLMFSDFTVTFGLEIIVRPW